MMDEATKLKLRNVMLDHKLTTWEIDSFLNNPEVSEEYFEHPAFQQFLIQRKAKAEESNQRKKQTVEKLPRPTESESIEAQVAVKEIGILDLNGKAEDWMIRLRNNFIRNAMKRYDYD